MELKNFNACGCPIAKDLLSTGLTVLILNGSELSQTVRNGLSVKLHHQ